MEEAIREHPSIHQDQHLAQDPLQIRQTWCKLTSHIALKWNGSKGRGSTTQAQPERRSLSQTNADTFIEPRFSAYIRLDSIICASDGENLAERADSER